MRMPPNGSRRLGGLTWENTCKYERSQKGGGNESRLSRDFCSEPQLQWRAACACRRIQMISAPPVGSRGCTPMKVKHSSPRVREGPRSTMDAVLIVVDDSSEILLHLESLNPSRSLQWRAACACRRTFRLTDVVPN